MKRIFCMICAVSLICLLSACQQQASAEQVFEASTPSVSTETPITTEEPATPQPAVEEPFQISSAGIVNGVIDDAFGARGTQLLNGVPSRSFPLAFQNIPEGTVCLALSVIDPDGGNWVHWLAVNVPAADLTENASIDLSANMVQGKNDFGFIGYGGPTPPSGTHTYVITVYALCENLDLKDGFSLTQFQEGILDNVLDSAALTGDYSH